jgi:hypothetical protein
MLYWCYLLPEDGRVAVGPSPGSDSLGPHLSAHMGIVGFFGFFRGLPVALGYESTPLGRSGLAPEYNGGRHT